MTGLSKLFVTDDKYHILNADSLRIMISNAHLKTTILKKLQIILHKEWFDVPIILMYLIENSCMNFSRAYCAQAIQITRRIPKLQLFI